VSDVPAKFYPSGTPMQAMEPGGYQYREISSGLLWFFRTPLGGAVLQCKPNEVYIEMDGTPTVTLNGWTLSGNVWRKQG
jgi:hypothetical protein